MSWVTLDDAAPLHEKQLAAGVAACWLWTCGLAYCYRKESKDGFIPEAAVKLLYPRVGLKEAKRLVEVGLWERVDGGYLIHDFLHWRSRRFGKVQAERGARGGSVISEVKRQAALDREAAKRLARAESTSTDHKPEAQALTTSDGHDGPQARASERSGAVRSESESPEGAPGEPSEDELLNPPDSDHETVIPLDFERKVIELGVDRILAKRLKVPLESVQARTQNFCGYWGSGAGMGKTKSNWMRAYREDVRQAKERNQLKPPGAIQHSARSGYRGTDDAPNVAASPALALMPGGGR